MREIACLCTHTISGTTRTHARARSAAAVGPSPIAAPARPMGPGPPGPGSLPHLWRGGAALLVPPARRLRRTGFGAACAGRACTQKGAREAVLWVQIGREGEGGEREVGGWREGKSKEGRGAVEEGKKGGLR